MECPTCGRDLLRIGETGLSYIYRCNHCGTTKTIHEYDDNDTRISVPEVARILAEKARPKEKQT